MINGADMIQKPPRPLQGLYDKYYVGKTDGSPVSPDARYFVLRLDSSSDDPAHTEASRKAVEEYALTIYESNPQLATELTAWLCDLYNGDGNWDETMRVYRRFQDVDGREEKDHALLD